MDDELLPAGMAAVREQWYKSERGCMKAKARRRNLLLPDWVIEGLTEHRQREQWTGAEDPVFAAKSGKQRARIPSSSATSSRPDGGWGCRGPRAGGTRKHFREDHCWRQA